MVFTNDGETSTGSISKAAKFNMMIDNPEAVAEVMSAVIVVNLVHVFT